MALQKINLDKDTTKPISDFCKNQGWVSPNTEITNITPAGEEGERIHSKGAPNELKRRYPQGGRGEGKGRVTTVTLYP